MTTIKDPIRQASLFTMHGLIDPRLMPEYSENKIEEKKVRRKARPFSSITFRGIVEHFLGRKIGYQ